MSLKEFEIVVCLMVTIAAGIGIMQGIHEAQRPQLPAGQRRAAREVYRRRGITP